MGQSDYVELHAKSAFSFLEAASIPEELASYCADYGQGAIGLTDFEGVYGAPRLHLACKNLGLRALIGAEVPLEGGARLTLLAESRLGYQNLCRLLTRMKMRHGLNGKVENAAAAPDDLREFAAGLVCLTGGDEGPLAHALHDAGKSGRAAAARTQAEQLCDIYGRNSVYVELQRHLRRDQEARNQLAVDLASSLALPVVATNGVTQSVRQKRVITDALTCIRNKVKLADGGKLLSLNSERHLKRGSEMQALFADLPHALAESVELSNRLQFTLANLGYEFPIYPVPDGETESSLLRKITDAGMLRRYGANNAKAAQQIDRELKLIEKLKLAGYFLTVWDIVEFCRREDILVQGRGSAANSAVCYSLGITAVDPVGMELLFERFLSEQRGEWPDIDIDLPSDTQREKAIQYVLQRYGPSGAAMTANVITYRGRSAVRDVGKAFGFSEQELKQISKLMPQFEWHDPKDTLESRFARAGFKLDNRLVSQFLHVTEQIIDLPRHLGQHSGGLVICQGRLDQIVPLEPASMANRVVVQWDKDDCADLGIVKVDLLGLGMLAVMQDSLTCIEQHYGEIVDLAKLPPKDDLVWSTLQTADTIGLFQVESRAQQAILPRMKPERFYDLVIQIAIIRPGPIVGQMLHPFLRRRQGLEQPESLHPLLDDVLKRTLGVPLFQEQLLRMAMIVAGFTGGEAEELRRAMGFKRSEKRMRDIETKLRAGMSLKGIEPELQERIIQSITSFALYGFPESHAASFALIAYASAYIKCHYLAAFTVCMLNNQPMGFYSPSTLVKDAQRHGQPFRPIDVQHSQYLCTIEHASGTRYVRLGFNYVAGLRAAAAKSIEAARAAGPFRSLRDFLRRVPEVNKRELATLAQLGALNSLPQQEQDRHRRGASWQTQLAAQSAGPLLEHLAAEEDSPSPLEAMTPPERIYADYQASGLSIGTHPIAFRRAELRTRGVLDNAAARQCRHGAIVTIAGCVITRQRPGTAKGFVFLSLEDETGIMNVIVDPDLFRRKTSEIMSPYVLVKGVLQNTWTVVSIKAADIQPLEFGAETVPSHDFY